jgi:hypothetical protein
MFTVTIIYPDFREKVASVQCVERQIVQLKEKTEAIDITYEDGKVERIWEGTIYVMNDKGATVAKYMPNRPDSAKDNK